MRDMAEQPMPGPSGIRRVPTGIPPNRSITATQALPNPTVQDAPARRETQISTRIANFPYELCTLLFALILGLLLFIFVFAVSFYLLSKVGKP